MKRRIKIYYLPQNELLTALRRQKSTDELPEFMNIPMLGGDPLPDGAIVEFIYVQPERRAIGVVVSHESFDLVAEGCEAPVVQDQLSLGYRAVRIVEP